MAWLPLGHEQINVATVQSLTVPKGSQMCLIATALRELRWRDDKTPPTAGASPIGHRILAGEKPMQYTGDLTALQIIGIGALPLADVSYYG